MSARDKRRAFVSGFTGSAGQFLSNKLFDAFSFLFFIYFILYCCTIHEFRVYRIHIKVIFLVMRDRNMIYDRTL